MPPRLNDPFDGERLIPVSSRDMTVSGAASMRVASGSWNADDRTRLSLFDGCSAAMRSSRRDILIGGAAALAAWPLRAAGGPGGPGGADARLRATLDGLAALPTPAAKLARLESFPATGLSHSAILDLATARQGLAVDVRLARVGQRDRAGRYPLLLERRLGEPIDVPAAHERLLDQWRSLADRADRLLRKQGFADGSIGERFAAIFGEARWHYPDSSAGRDSAVADMNATLARAVARVPALIGPVPAYCLTARVRRMTPEDEAAGRGGYRVIATPTMQGGYFVDLSDIARRPGWSLGSVVHHELVPGHMIQLPIEAAANPHPLRIAYASAFPEGWATYAEALAADSGAFDGDDMALLGCIHWLLFRIGRGLADTGIHHAGWSREEALDTVRAVQGVPAFFAPFERDIDRIVRDPAIRAAEALTWLRLEDLRREAGASAAAGAATRRFHQIVLADGRKRLETIAAELRAGAAGAEQ